MPVPELRAFIELSCCDHREKDFGCHGDMANASQDKRTQSAIMCRCNYNVSGREKFSYRVFLSRAFVCVYISMNIKSACVCVLFVMCDCM